MKIFQIIFISLVITNCNGQINTKTNNTSKVKQPNIVWIVTEDISPTLSCYGDNTAKTPNLDALAKDSMVYDNAFTVVGVCGPSRSAIITGMYPTSIGTQHMRTGKDVHSWGKRIYSRDVDINDVEGNQIIEYAAVIPEAVKCFTEYLRESGYYCTNNQKTDYQFAAPVTAWNENNTKAHWKNAPEGKPFFSVFNIGTTHESKLWLHDNMPLTVNPEHVNVPSYLPDNEATRKTIARHYSNIELMDAQVGVFINQLKDHGLYDNTIIFFYSDHGGPLPRQKREIYDSGLKVPFIIKGIYNESGRTDRLISFVDLAPTMLSLAGIKTPNYMEGRAFLGEYQAQKRDYIFGSSDRFDEHTDRIRAVRNNHFLYLRNDFPELTKYKDIGYRKNIRMMPVFIQLKEENKLTETQQIWFDAKTNEELYDCNKDPDNIHNLVNNTAYTSILANMRATLEAHLKNRIDYGVIPESEMIQSMWPNFEQPVTKPVTLSLVVLSPENKITMASQTPGASIAYLISDKVNETLDFNSKWNLYTKPISVENGKTIYTMAQRIGYRESEIKSQTIE